MRRLELRWCGLLVAVLLLNVTQWASGAPFWSENFQSMPMNASVNGQDTTWQCINASLYYGTTTPDPSDSSNKSLTLISYYTAGDYHECARWYDDTASAPHNGLIEFTWAMKRDPSAGWMVSVQGFGGVEVASIANDPVGSQSSIDAYTSSGWVETLATVPSDLTTWKTVVLDVDFAASPVRYKVRAGTGPWSDWYTEGNSATYFRLLSFSANHHTNGASMFDDFTATPEPCTFMLLGCGGLAALLKRRRAQTGT
jgi:hypothetical protein